MIKGVKTINLVEHKDKRGFFKEIFSFDLQFPEIPIGQLSHSMVKEGVIKCWHGHVYQYQWNYVLNGEINVSLIDKRKESNSYNDKMEFIADSKIAYFFPPGVFHGYKCMKGPMNIIYLTSGTYDLNDEIRKSSQDLKIKHSWD